MTSARLALLLLVATLVVGRLMHQPIVAGCLLVVAVVCALDAFGGRMPNGDYRDPGADL